jgi:hypothetical protein
MSILLSPVSSSVYVGTSGSTVLDLKVPTAPASVPINPQPWGLTISPDGSQLLAYSSKTTAADSIDIDISSGTFGTPTPLSSISSLLPDSGVMSAVYYDNEKLFVVGAKGDKLDFATVDTVALDTSSTPLGQGSAVIPAYDGSGIGVALAKPTNITNVSLMACVATMGKVVLIDLTEPANPVVRGSITLPYYLTASKLPLTPSIAVSSDGASIYVSWSGVVYSLHVGS